MVLVDTSVWVAHFREGMPGLEHLLNEGEVIIHPFIIGELACGGIKNRKEILSLLHSLPISLVIELDEYLTFIESQRLIGKGIGFVDIHLLASALLESNFLWTRDKNLKSMAQKLKLSFTPRSR